jgi:hypothetical protein
MGRIRQWLDKPYPYIFPRSALVGFAVVWFASIIPWVWLYLLTTLVRFTLVLRSPSWADRETADRGRRALALVTTVVIFTFLALLALGIQFR